MIQDAFEVERDVAKALFDDGSAMAAWHAAYMRKLYGEHETTHVPMTVAASAMTPADAELVADVIRQRDLYQIMALSLEASRDAANARAERAERDRSILAVRCAEQAKELARLLTKYEPHGVVWPAEDHPIHTAIATMQRGGLR